MGRLGTLRTLIMGTALGAASAFLAPRLKRSATGDGDPASRAVAAFLGTPCAAERRVERAED